MDNQKNITSVIISVQIEVYYDTIDMLMRGLHDSEQEQFNKAARWDDIRESYMQHVIDTQKEYDGTCLVAYVNEKAAGFIFGYDEEQDDSRIETYTGHELYVSDGYVLPQYRRMGVYRQLNNALEQHYINKGIRKITRFTLVSNVRMQQFLEEEGYKPVRLLYEKWLNADGIDIEPLILKKPED